MSGAVVIRRCASAEEAVIVCALLENAGIPASIDNWHHITMDWGAVHALGGVALRVPAALLDAARQTIIDHAESADDRLASEFPQPNADSLPQKRAPARLRLVLFTGIVYFLMTPLGMLINAVVGPDEYPWRFWFFPMPVGHHADRAYELLEVFFWSLLLAPFLVFVAAIVLLADALRKPTTARKHPA